ncbi:putative FKBP-type peptidyl-prolyl cis-trans isomerase [Mariniflexile rhizosphaerae]|uniref:FKBP-type peptidyl-prolyl cis-trans isomerase n=1 Tax=unclassified Mariniflexile TaxID=2643887 RepID=UPI000CB6177E|nr:FKBP-type peptidyl-prolyl cis-trans isomerase [Mariniflexile sp. TRM1-10]AXP82876.1 putative FKBP-type peptidyl-prolyl cis-trans isomerase [Mariniflexile sp. TRM1-10]PLB18213.1 MAG: Peptidyl-prolyl cis-trans isomerase [Flavobacteriaceae bacterium FS1-H7996/R]
MKHIIFSFALFLFFSCSSNDKEDKEIDYVALNEQQISDYIAENNLDAQRSDSGLYYIIEEPGTGDQPTSTSDVTVAYKGYFLNGSVFNQSNAQGISFNLQEVIRGWTEGITYFKEGGRGKLLIPAHLGYGNVSRKGIPAGFVLIFDIELIAVN